MWEFHDSNVNCLGDIWWTDKFNYFRVIDGDVAASLRRLRRFYGVPVEYYRVSAEI